MIKTKNRKIIIIGFGVAGRRYFDILKKKNIDILVLRKSKNKIFYKNRNIAISKDELNNMINLASDGIKKIIEIQKKALNNYE